MFLVQKTPTARDPNSGTWIPTPHPTKAESGMDFPGASSELTKLRDNLPLNGETAFADTAAAFAALPNEEQEKLEKLQVRRRLNEGKEGFLAPLVHLNSRSGVKSLHSPLWGNRRNVRPIAEVEGLSAEESRKLLLRLEEHVLHPKFRYDHAHREGDVTVWNNFSTIHAAPPVKVNISEP